MVSISEDLQTFAKLVDLPWEEMVEGRSAEFNERHREIARVELVRNLIDTYVAEFHQGNYRKFQREFKLERLAVWYGRKVLGLETEPEVIHASCKEF